MTIEEHIENLKAIASDMPSDKCSDWIESLMAGINAMEELQTHREAWEKCIKEIKEWYWNADKQAIAKDPCVVDAMVDLFIRTIKECRPKEGDDIYDKRKSIDYSIKDC